MNGTTQRLLAAARPGISRVDVPEDLRAAALVHLEDWLRTDKLAGLSPESSYRPILEWMVEAGRFDLLVDSFYQVIPFGTGGRRGPVGIGPNRINPYTIASSVQGHAEYLRRRFPGGTPLSVVLAYDVRSFHDLRGTYPPGLPNPLLGLSSRKLAGIAASVYRAAGVTVYTLPEDDGSYISTPELSFLIRHLGAQGGLNVSASHNHPDDNGSKFYNAEGGQEIPPDDEELADIVEGIREVRLATGRGAARGLHLPVPAAARQAFIDLNLALQLRRRPGPACFVFTGLHGSGIDTVGRCLEDMGFDQGSQLFYVENQCEFRSDFRHVRFRSPNPEVPAALEPAVELARQRRADLVLATDPDADRLGGASRDGNDYRFISGNEFAAVLARYRLESLEAAGRMPRRPLAIKTTVTTSLISRLVEARGGLVVGDLLVGFKYIANVLRSLERVGRFSDAAAAISDFVIAAEESHGYMLSTDVRDKDAAGAAVVLAELASELAERGETVYDYLVDTYKRFGYHANMVRSTVMQGAQGAASIRRIQQLWRDSPPRVIGGRAVQRVNDHWDEERHGPFLSVTDRSARNLISFDIEGGIKATIRPSGTEPKNKVYLELASAPVGAEATREEFDSHRREVDREVKAFAASFLADMLALIGVSLPEFAFDISDLVPLRDKVDFCNSFLPEFEKKASAAVQDGTPDETLNRWVDGALAAYGPDARELVRNGFHAYAASLPDSESVRLQRRVFASR